MRGNKFSKLVQEPSAASSWPCRRGWERKERGDGSKKVDRQGGWGERERNGGKTVCNRRTFQIVVDGDKWRRSRFRFTRIAQSPVMHVSCLDPFLPHLCSSLVLYDPFLPQVSAARIDTTCEHRPSLIRKVIPINCSSKIGGRVAVRSTLRHGNWTLPIIRSRRGGEAEGKKLVRGYRRQLPIFAE